MLLIDFIRMYLEDDDFTIVKFFWSFDEESNIDEEYSFEGKPSEFIWYYTEAYDCIDGFKITDVDNISIKHIHCCGFTRSEIIISYCRG